MVEEFNKLNTKPRNIADLKLNDDLQTIWDNLPDKTIIAILSKISQTSGRACKNTNQTF